MGSLLAKAFIPPGDLLGCETTVDETGSELVTCEAPFASADWSWGMAQVLTLMAVYGYVLFSASNLLSEGSELLLLVPSLAGIVGSVVLPILGAVPDGAIMLFSGLGPDAQEQLSVGVGALAGSTIMLLTIPWGLSIYAGRVVLRGGSADYSSKSRRGTTMSKSGMSVFFSTGVTPGPSIRANASIMLATSLIYLLIQYPAFKYAMEPASDEKLDGSISDEHWWALVGLVAATGAFFVYLVLMVMQAGADEHTTSLVDDKLIEQLEQGKTVSLAGLLAPIIANGEAHLREDTEKGISISKGLDCPLLADREKARLGKLLNPFFAKYDTDGDKRLDASEIRLLLADVNMPISRETAHDWMAKLDGDGSGYIEIHEMLDAVLALIKERMRTDLEIEMGRPPSRMGSTAGPSDAEEEGEEEEEAEIPEELSDLPWPQQQAAIKNKAFGMMGIGTLLILIFSDPMVDVMSNVGTRIGVPPFYVAFVLAPLASNASELIASYSYAAKKSAKTITVSLAALEGAACMNNTFCLAIFMGLIYFKGLAWNFTAETLAILIIELIIGLAAMQSTHVTYQAFLILALFPVSIVFVAALEGSGID